MSRAVRFVRVASSALDEIRRHAHAAYPAECCGFLLGTPEPDPLPPFRTVLEAEPARNATDAAPERRFVIRSDELRDAESRAVARGRALLGFYHSHPDRPAIPSQEDLANAWPWYTYLVFGPAASPDVRTYELDAGAGELHAVPLAVFDPRSTEACEDL
jgi:proteasome lid subunit RPN8/RPN11